MVTVIAYIFSPIFLRLSWVLYCSSSTGFERSHNDQGVEIMLSLCSSSPNMHLTGETYSDQGLLFLLSPGSCISWVLM